MRQLLTVISGIFASLTVAANPVMLDLNFDGHPDQMIVRRKAEGGSKYEIKLYDPQTKTYRVDPVFSEYIVGLPPELNAREKTIQLRLQMSGYDRPIPGYKFLVKDGKLCFLSGKPMPEKLAWPLAGKLTPEMIDFDREVAGAEYTVLLKERRALEKQFTCIVPPHRSADLPNKVMQQCHFYPSVFDLIQQLAQAAAE